MVVLAAMIVAVSFTPTSDKSEPSRATTATDDDLEDLDTIADQMGISLEEALNRYGWHGDFSRTVSDIKAVHPGSFTTAAVTSDLSASVSFVEAVPVAAQEVINDFEMSFPAVAVETHAGMGFTE